MTPFRKHCQKVEMSIALGMAYKMALDNGAMRDCLIAYRNGRDAHDGEQLSYSGELFYRLSRTEQANVEIILEAEYPQESA